VLKRGKGSKTHDTQQLAKGRPFSVAKVGKNKKKKTPQKKKKDVSNPRGVGNPEKN